MNNNGLWLKTFLDNYNGITPESQEIEEYMKENYKGNSYIPWATMERLVYTQDADAEFKIIKNEQGGFVHTDVQINHQRNLQKGEVVSETIASMFNHMVVVSLTFLGKEFIETYPVQDKDYTALRNYDQNAINKALQRAKAKVASRATGIGYKLYEGYDLQFDAPVAETKPDLSKGVSVSVAVPTITVESKPEKATKKTTKKELVGTMDEIAADVVDGNIEEGTTVTITDSEVSDEVKELYNLIKEANQEKITSVLQKLNVAIVKKYGVALNTTDDISKFNEKAKQLTDVKKFTNTIKNLLG